MITHHVPREVLRELDRRSRDEYTGLEARLDREACRGWLGDVERDAIGSACESVDAYFRASTVDDGME